MNHTITNQRSCVIFEEMTSNKIALGAEYRNIVWIY